MLHLPFLIAATLVAIVTSSKRPTQFPTTKSPTPYPTTSFPTSFPTSTRAPTISCEDNFGSSYSNCIQDPTEVSFNFYWVVDASGSIGRTNFDTQLDFVRSVTSDIDTCFSVTDNTMVLFSDTSSLVSYPYDNIAYLNGWTNTYSAFTTLLGHLNSNPTSENNVIVLLSDGIPTCGATCLLRN